MSACPLCLRRLDPHTDDVVRPGPLWDLCHVECWVSADDEDEASSRTTTYHAQNQGDAMESLQ